MNQLREIGSFFTFAMVAVLTREWFGRHLGFLGLIPCVVLASVAAYAIFKVTPDDAMNGRLASEARKKAKNHGPE